MSARRVCASCGAWVDQSSEASTWATRHAEFNALHVHVPGSPLVIKRAITDAERDTWLAAVTSKGRVMHQVTPTGSAWVAFVSKPAAPSIKHQTVEKVYAASPDELKAKLS
jgi:hypothetical protein